MRVEALRSFCDLLRCASCSSAPPRRNAAFELQRRLRSELSNEQTFPQSAAFLRHLIIIS
jgi:hypothetical protein